VRITGAGASRVDVRTPRLTMSAHGVVATQRGSVAISWTRAASSFTLDITVPANVTATVHVPVPTVDRVRESGRPVDGDPGVVSARAAAGEVLVTIGSGHYSFAAA
jgi:hypothetical protein